MQLAVNAHRLVDLLHHENVSYFRHDTPDTTMCAGTLQHKVFEEK